MRLKMTFAALAIVAVPGLAIAECSWQHINQSASQCPQGQTLDESKGTCVPLTSS